MPILKAKARLYIVFYFLVFTAQYNFILQDDGQLGCNVIYANSPDHLQGTVVSDYAVGSSEISGVATKSLYIPVICRFPNILRTNFTISPRYSGHLACAWSEIIETVLHRHFQVFQLLFGGVGEIFSFTEPQSQLSLRRGSHSVSDPRPLHRPLNLSRK